VKKDDLDFNLQLCVTGEQPPSPLDMSSLSGRSGDFCDSSLSSIEDHGNPEECIIVRPVL